MSEEEKKREEEREKLTREEVEHIARAFAFVKKRDPQLYEFLKQYCAQTGLKPHELILHALRTWRNLVLSEEILRSMTAYEWQKLKFAVLFDVQTTLQLLQIANEMYFKTYLAHHLTLIEQMGEVYMLRRAYRERTRAFKLVQRIAKHIDFDLKVLETLLRIHMRELVQRLKKTLKGRKQVETEHGTQTQTEEAGA